MVVEAVAKRLNNTLSASTSTMIHGCWLANDFVASRETTIESSNRDVRVYVCIYVIDMHEFTEADPYLHPEPYRQKTRKTHGRDGLAVKIEAFIVIETFEGYAVAEPFKINKKCQKRDPSSKSTPTSPIYLCAHQLTTRLLDRSHAPSSSLTASPC